MEKSELPLPETSPVSGIEPTSQLTLEPDPKSKQLTTQTQLEPELEPDLEPELETQPQIPCESEIVRAIIQTIQVYIRNSLMDTIYHMPTEDDPSKPIGLFHYLSVGGVDSITSPERSKSSKPPNFKGFIDKVIVALESIVTQSEKYIEIYFRMQNCLHDDLSQIYDILVEINQYIAQLYNMKMGKVTKNTLMKFLDKMYSICKSLEEVDDTNTGELLSILDTEMERQQQQRNQQQLQQQLPRAKKKKKKKKKISGVKPLPPGTLTTLRNFGVK